MGSSADVEETTDSTVATFASADCQPVEDLRVFVLRRVRRRDQLGPRTTFENGGTVTPANGAVSLASDGPAFPYVVTTADPFAGLTRLPVDGGLRLRLGRDFGTGVVAVDVEHPNGMEVGSVPSNRSARCGRTRMDGNSSRNSSSRSCQQTPNRTRWVRSRVGRTRTVTLDGDKVAPCQGDVEPVTLWFGNPSVSHEECPSAWSAVTVEFIRIDTPA